MDVVQLPTRCTILCASCRPLACPSPSTISADMTTSTTQNDLPTAVQELSAAASAVHNAQQVSPDRHLSVPVAEIRLVTPQAMQNNKDKWGEVSKIIRQIDTCVNNTAKAVYHRGEGVPQPVVVVAALGATGECVFHVAPIIATDLF